MKTEIVITNNFSKEAKKLLKKYKSLKLELRQLNEELLHHPKLGTPIGQNSYKIRLAVKSKGKGKSGGLRIITYVELKIHFDEITNTVYLLSVYDKSETDSISGKELSLILSKLKN
jgi:mRNA-degrading endonuclease RelE of RelBE toxin-antitoxin system